MTQQRELVRTTPKSIFLGGRWENGSDSFGVTDPGTGERLCEVADAQDQHARAALDIAVAKQRGWADTPPRERGEILRRAWQLLTDRADEFATLMTLEMGKSLAESRAEVIYAAEFFRWFSEMAVRIDGRYTRGPAGGDRVLVTKQPVGPCLLITPWNFPLAMGTRKIGPAVAAGCTMIVKPAQLTPLSMLKLADVLAEAGLPDGVLSVLPSTSASRISEPLMSDARLRKVSFTGSTEVGKKLVAASGENLQRMSMELGGNAPFLVFADADLDAAVDGAVTAKMRNNGESCVAANRFHVSASVAGEFADRLTLRMQAMRVAHGTADGTQVGPLINDGQRATVRELVDDAAGKGARVRTGGHPVEGRGFFYEPTVLTEVPADARILTEEAFGPVAPITTFGDEDEAVMAANNTEYGLVGYVFTNDLNRAVRVGERLETGMVGLNTGMVSNANAPFGGIKFSGFGREGGPEGIEEYLDTKYLALKLG